MAEDDIRIRLGLKADPADTSAVEREMAEVGRSIESIFDRVFDGLDKRVASISRTAAGAAGAAGTGAAPPVPAPAPSAATAAAVGTGGGGGGILGFIRSVTTAAERGAAMAAAFVGVDRTLTGIIGTIGAANTAAAQHTIALDMLRKGMQDTAGTFTQFRAQIERTGDVLGYSYDQIIAATRAYAATGLRAETRGPALGRTVRGIEQFASGYGQDPGQMAGMFAGLVQQGYGIGTGGQRALAVSIADALQSGGMQGRLEEMVGALQSLTTGIESRTAQTPNMQTLLSILTTANASGQRGLQGARGAQVFGQLDQAISGMGTGSQGSQLAFYQALSRGGKLNYAQTQYRAEEGVAGPGNLRDVMTYAHRLFGGQGRSVEQLGISQMTGLSMHQVEALENVFMPGGTFRTGQFGNLQKMLSQRGVKLENVSEQALPVLAQLANGGNVQEAARAAREQGFKVPTGNVTREQLTRILLGTTPQAVDDATRAGTQAIAKGAESIANALLPLTTQLKTRYGDLLRNIGDTATGAKDFNAAITSLIASLRRVGFDVPGASEAKTLANDIKGILPHVDKNTPLIGGFAGVLNPLIQGAGQAGAHALAGLEDWVGQHPLEAIAGSQLIRPAARVAGGAVRTGGRAVRGAARAARGRGRGAKATEAADVAGDPADVAAASGEDAAGVHTPTRAASARTPTADAARVRFIRAQAAAEANATARRLYGRNATAEEIAIVEARLRLGGTAPPTTLRPRPGAASPADASLPEVPTIAAIRRASASFRAIPPTAAPAAAPAPAPTTPAGGTSMPSGAGRYTRAEIRSAMAKLSSSEDAQMRIRARVNAMNAGATGSALGPATDAELVTLLEAHGMLGGPAGTATVHSGIGPRDITGPMERGGPGVFVGPPDIVNLPAVTAGSHAATQRAALHAWVQSQVRAGAIRPGDAASREAAYWATYQSQQSAQQVRRQHAGNPLLGALDTVTSPITGLFDRLQTPLPAGARAAMENAGALPRLPDVGQGGMGQGGMAVASQELRTSAAGYGAAVARTLVKKTQAATTDAAATVSRALPASVGLDSATQQAVQGSAAQMASSTSATVAGHVDTKTQSAAHTLADGLPVQGALDSGTRTAITKSAQDSARAMRKTVADFVSGLLSSAQGTLSTTMQANSGRPGGQSGAGAGSGASSAVIGQTARIFGNLPAPALAQGFYGNSGYEESGWIAPDGSISRTQVPGGRPMAHVHGGDDFDVPTGTAVYAPYGGRISKAAVGNGTRQISAANNWGYGTEVVVQTANKQFQTILGHLSKLAVQTGQQVQAGQLLGYTGSTGNSSGPHLHVELQRLSDMHSIDPLNMIRGRGQWATLPTTAPGETPGAGGGGNVGAVPSYVPTRFRGMVAAAAKATGIPAALLAAQINAESSFQPNARNGAASGIAQFMPATAASMGVDPWDPKSAIMGMARLDQQNFKMFGNYPSMIAAYNASSGAVKAAGGVPAITETQNYVRRIMNAYKSAPGATAAAGIGGGGNPFPALPSGGTSAMQVQFSPIAVQVTLLYPDGRQQKASVQARPRARFDGVYNQPGSR